MDSEFSGTLDAQNGLAWSLFSSGAIEEAQRVFEKVLNRHPTFQGAVEGLQAIEDTLNKRLLLHDIILICKNTGWLKKVSGP